jgi:hypothetical protein
LLLGVAALLGGVALLYSPELPRRLVAWLVKRDDLLLTVGFSATRLLAAYWLSPIKRARDTAWSAISSSTIRTMHTSKRSAPGFCSHRCSWQQFARQRSWLSNREVFGTPFGRSTVTLRRAPPRFSSKDELEEIRASLFPSESSSKTAAATTNALSPERQPRPRS